jgi:hypothetical protein
MISIVSVVRGAPCDATVAELERRYADVVVFHVAAWQSLPDVESALPSFHGEADAPPDQVPWILRRRIGRAVSGARVVVFRQAWQVPPAVLGKIVDIFVRELQPVANEVEHVVVLEGFPGDVLHASFPCYRFVDYAVHPYDA